jgi:hypothetical protein
MREEEGETRQGEFHRKGNETRDEVTENDDRDGHPLSDCERMIAR